VNAPDVRKYVVKKDELQLLIIDIQERLVAAMPDGLRVVANTEHLLALSAMLSLPTLVTEQYPRGLGSTVPELRGSVPAPVEKLEFSCMCLPEVTSRLRSAGRRYVAVAGMEAHVCVLQTCLDLLAQGYLVHVVRDAVCSRSAEDKDNALEMMRGAGAVITTTETLLFQILGRAGTDEFKAISKRIK
jgi:nicotinamidase-related amidase